MASMANNVEIRRGGNKGGKKPPSYHPVALIDVLGPILTSRLIHSISCTSSRFRMDTVHYGQFCQTGPA
jgi:hypothetical protein